MCFCYMGVLLLCCASVAAQTIRIDTTAPVNTVRPREAVGAGIDRVLVEAIDRDLTKQALAPLFEAGWQPVTYRQNTELAVEAWHRNPEGSWSGGAGQGYFTGSRTSRAFIRHSFGYALPHRGVTRNDGTGNTGYSRLTDGDETTYWKSSLYLISRFTGEDDALHPRWVVLDLSRE
jgi:hypothetical protein